MTPEELAVDLAYKLQEPVESVRAVLRSLQTNPEAVSDLLASVDDEGEPVYRYHVTGRLADEIRPPYWLGGTLNDLPKAQELKANAARAGYVLLDLRRQRVTSPVAEQPWEAVDG